MPPCPGMSAFLHGDRRALGPLRSFPIAGVFAGFYEAALRSLNEVPYSTAIPKDRLETRGFHLRSCQSGKGTQHLASSS